MVVVIVLCSNLFSIAMFYYLSMFAFLLFCNTILVVGVICCLSNFCLFVYSFVLSQGVVYFNCLTCCIWAFIFYYTVRVFNVHRVGRTLIHTCLSSLGYLSYWQAYHIYLIFFITNEHINYYCRPF